jgi:hypothetical protein
VVDTLQTHHHPQQQQ